jgi:hypothetical protein
MPVGGSGRIVIEIDPELKQELYGALSEQGINLKQWFLKNAKTYLNQRVQPTLPLFVKDEDEEYIK